MRKDKRVLFLGNLMIAYNRDVLRGVAKCAANRPEIRVFFPDSFESADIPRLLQGDVHGVIAAGCPPAWRLPETIAKRRLPAVDISAELKPSSVPRVVTDDAMVGRMAANYFIDRGFKRLVYYGLSQHYSSDVRQEGFCQQASKHGIIARCFQKENAEAEDRAGIFPSTAARWLKDLPKPTAIFAADDHLGAYLVEACQHLKIRIPEDVALLGVDNDDLYGQLRTPHLSSILQNTQEIGLRAMELLYRVMRGRKVRSSTILIEPVRVITRLSSDIFGVEDEVVREALGLIQQRLRNGLSVKWLADQLAISRPTLDRRFLAALNRTPTMEIQRTQMETARQLILDSDMPIAQVAEASGYSSPRQFSTSFHRYFKQTPRDMRKTHRYAAPHSPDSRTEPSFLPNQKGYTTRYWDIHRH